MPKKVLRTIQPAHKSDHITVEQAKEAWLRVFAKTRNGGSNGKKTSVPSAVRVSETPET